MTDMHHDVGEFHEKFGLDNTNTQDTGPRNWDKHLIKFRQDFLSEELDEFNEGVREHDHAKMADALVDIVYVALGTAHLMGYPWEQLWNDVQRANMTKVRAQKDGSDSVRKSAFDVVKPAGWEPPHTEQILERHGFTT